MTRIEEIEKASKEYRKGREECGVKDPILLDEVEEAYYLGAEWADTNPVHRDVDLTKEYDNEFFKDPILGKLVNRNVGISIAKHFYELGLKAKEEYIKGIPLNGWQIPCADPNYPCENPQMDCINCPRFGHPQGTITTTNTEE